MQRTKTLNARTIAKTTNKLERSIGSSPLSCFPMKGSKTAAANPYPVDKIAYYCRKSKLFLVRGWIKTENHPNVIKLSGVCGIAPVARCLSSVINGR